MRWGTANPGWACRPNSPLTVGVTSTDLVGRAYNLRSPSDIAGTYTSVGGGVVLAGGVRLVRLRNSNGVGMTVAMR